MALVLLVGSCLCAALAYIPARLFIPEDHYLTSGRFAMIERVRGTIWNGQVLLLTKNRQIQLLVDWKLRKSCLFGLKLCHEIQVKTTAPRGKSSELYFSMGVPLSSFLFSSGCAPVSRFQIYDLNGLVSSQFLSAFVPELLGAEQHIGLRNLSLELDFKKGVLTYADGQVDIDAGTVRYTSPNGTIQSQKVEQLSGQFLESDGYELILKGKNGNSYFGILTDTAQERLRFVVYDSFVQAFGAAAIRSTPTNVPRFEISQKLSDMLCESSS